MSINSLRLITSYSWLKDKSFDYVCVEEDGKIVYPDHLTKKFADLIKENGLRHIRFHDLRHSCASNMLASGVPLKEIQEWLGHSDFSTTANVYPTRLEQRLKFN